MRRRTWSTRAKAGLPPGSLVHVGERRQDQVRLLGIVYDRVSVQVLEGLEDASHSPHDGQVLWFRVQGIHDLELLRDMGERFGIHPLTLEDILDATQRPKIEVSEDSVFLILKRLTVRDGAPGIDVEQVSLILGADYVLSFEEWSSDLFAPAEARILNDHGRVRKMGADYLAYALLDLVVDGYLDVLEVVGERIDVLEATLVSDPDTALLQDLYALKADLAFVRKAVWPLREVVSQLGRGESALIQSDTTLYLRDLYDHTIQVIEMIETYRELLSSMLDIYLSSVSNRMNEVMKVLTVISTLFIPLTFLAGVYGMNFQHMPELGWEWAYPALWGVMGLIGLAMVLYFRRKKWL